MKLISSFLVYFVISMPTVEEEQNGKLKQPKIWQPIPLKAGKVGPYTHGSLVERQKQLNYRIEKQRKEQERRDLYEEFF